MSIDNKAQAAAKNLEGKAQEAAGEVTGDPKLKVEGKAKQVQAMAMNLVEDAKDKAHDVLDAIKDKIDGV